MRSETIEVRTGHEPQVYDLTRECARFVTDTADGLLSVFVPHATAGVAVLETGAGSDDDLLGVLEDVLPRTYRWGHRHGSPGHGRDHVLPAFVAPSMTVPVVGGAAAARDVAVDLSRRHECRQPRPPGAVELPRGLNLLAG